MESQSNNKRKGIENTENWYAFALAVLCGFTQKKAIKAMRISTREPVYKGMKEGKYGRVYNL